MPNGRFKEEQIRDSLQSVLMMQKCQVGIKDNPRLDFDLEMLQFCLDNRISSDVSKPGEQLQNGKAENVTATSGSTCVQQRQELTQPD